MDDNRELVWRAGRGDTGAFAELYKEIYKDLYRFAFYTLGNPEDAKDAVSDAVTDAFAAIGTLKKPEAFRSWMFRILTAKCSRKRKEYVRKTQELPEDLKGPDTLQENAAVHHAFGRLSGEERMILSLQVFGGYKSAEIAKMLQSNENTIRSKKSRALQKLAEMLRD